MRFRWTILALGLIVAVATMAATAGARVTTTHAKTTTITFWDAYSSDGPEVKRLEKVLIPQFEKEHPGIKVKDVIGHNESLSSPYHHENVARLRTQTHGDMTHATMKRYRKMLAKQSC